MSGLIWKGYLPSNDVRGAAELLNEYGWHLSWKVVEGRWHLWGGDQLLFVGATQAELEAFLYGMAISLVVLPDELLEEIKQLAEE